MASSSTHRIGDEPTDSEDMAPGKKQRTGSAPVHSVQEHDYMSTLSAVCASRSLEHLSETLVPAYASSCQEQLSETPALASGPGSSPTAALRGGASKGTPLPRGKASEPGSEPDASSEYMSEATTTEDEAPRTSTTQPPAGLDFKAVLDFNAFSGLEALSAAVSATSKGETSAIAPAPISLAAAIPESPSAWRAKWIQSGQRRCLVCGTAESPKWRCSMTLCNACGLRKAKQGLGGLGAQYVVSQLLRNAPDARARHAAMPHCQQDAHANWISVMDPMRHATLPYSTGTPIPLGGMPPGCMPSASFTGYGQYGILYPMAQPNGEQERLAPMLPQHSASMAAGVVMMPSPVLSIAPFMRPGVTASGLESSAPSESQPWWQYHSQAARIAESPQALYHSGMYPHPFGTVAPSQDPTQMMSLRDHQRDA